MNKTIINILSKSFSKLIRYTYEIRIDISNKSLNTLIGYDWKCNTVIID